METTKSEQQGWHTAGQERMARTTVTSSKLLTTWTENDDSPTTQIAGHVT